MNGIDTLLNDVVFTARLLLKSPIFTATVVLTIGLGVGVNTGVFSVVNARTLPATAQDYRAAAGDVNDVICP